MDFISTFRPVRPGNVEITMTKKLTIPAVLESLVDRPVAVFGNKVSGQGAMELLHNLAIEFVCYDEHIGDVLHRQFTSREAVAHDLVIFSPGFSTDHSWLQTAKNTGCICLTELDFASLFWPGWLVSITGTNGKSTLSEFLTFAYKRLGNDSISVGNIGFPFSRLFSIPAWESLFVVCEVSSFQAETLQHYRSDVLIWTNFGEDHLDRYPSMREYFAAKWNLIRRLRRPVFIVGDTVAEAAAEYGFKLPEYAVISKSDESLPWKLKPNNVFASGPQRENLRLAVAYWKREGLPLGILKQAMERFRLSKHRLSLVKEIEGVEYWNDSKATNFNSALAAMRNFEDRNVIWIGGGKSKGGDIVHFAGQMAQCVQAGIVMGQTSQTVFRHFQALGKPCSRIARMRDAVEEAHRIAKPGDVVLLSPGFSSLDLFESYVDRGNSFEKSVFSLKKSNA